MRKNSFGLFHLIYYNVCFFDKKKDQIQSKQINYGFQFSNINNCKIWASNIRRLGLLGKVQ